MIAAVEDALSEAVVRRIVAEVRPDLTIQVMRKNGQGYVKTRIRELNRTADAIPVLVLIDQDRPEPCPADLIREWLPIRRGSHLLFRVAVMEIESWVLADGDALAKFLGVSSQIVPGAPDEVAQPKELIVSLARRSKKKAIREDLVPLPDDVRKVGAAYNPRLIAFVEKEWRLEAATGASPSLRKAVERLKSAF